MLSYLRTVAAGLAACLIAGTAAADITPGTYVMGIDSTLNRVMLLDAQNGSIVNTNYIDLSSMDAGTPKHAIQVGNEVWVSDQLRDRIDRFDLMGNYLSTIGGTESSGIDNIRGMAVFGNTVYLANGGSNQGAPGNAIIQLDFSGNILGHFTVPSSPWAMISWGDNMLLSYSGTGVTRIDELTLAGDLIGTFYQGQANFFQQISPASSGGVWAAAFSGLETRGIYGFDADGNQTNFWNVGPARGVFELGNGNLLWSDGTGIDILDPNTGDTNLIYSGSTQFFGMVVIPAPGVATLLLLAGGMVGGRRRRRN